MLLVEDSCERNEYLCFYQVLTVIGGYVMIAYICCETCLSSIKKGSLWGDSNNDEGVFRWCRDANT